MQDNKFEAWAIIELFGHNKIAGKVTETTIGGGSFVRVDVPNTSTSPSFTRLLNPSAIYAINPVTEDVAKGYADRLNTKPIEAWDAREVLKRIDEAKKLNAHEPVEVDDEQEEEEEEEEIL